MQKLELHKCDNNNFPLHRGSDGSLYSPLQARRALAIGVRSCRSSIYKNSATVVALEFGIFKRLN